MRIVILTHGTRGDVQPFLVAGRALIEAGYEVRVTVPPNLLEFASRSGVPCVEIAGDSREMLESKEGREWLSAGNMRRFFAAYTELMNKWAEAVCGTALDACEGADAIMANALMDDVGEAIAEKRGIPLIAAYSQPFAPRSDFAHPLVTTRSVPFGAVRRYTYKLAAGQFFAARGPAMKILRDRLGLPMTGTAFALRADELGHTILQLWSKALVPDEPDSPATRVTTGFMTVPAMLRDDLGETRAPRALVEWIEAGPPPIYLGFGSMPVLDPAAMTRVALGVGADTGTRILISAGWNDIAGVDIPDRAYLLTEGVDHDWLFPRCSGLVHHGGAGTIAAGVQAGVPALVCSVFADQPFWGDRLVRLGAGAHVPYRKLDQRRLAQGIRILQRNDVKQRAAALSRDLRADQPLTCLVDGVRRATA